MSELVGFAFWIAVFLMGAGVPILIVIWIIRKAKSGGLKVKRFPDAFLATMRAAGAQQVSDGFLVEHDGVAYRFRYYPNSEGPDTIRVDRPIPETPVSGALPELPVMRLREENDRDRLGKRLHLNREVQTGDALFDARIYIECDARQRTSRRMLASPKVRKGVTGLLALGFRFVDFRAQRCALKADWIQGTAPFDRRIVEQSVMRLAQIADNLPAFRRVPTSSPMTAGGVVGLLSWLLAGVSLVVFLLADRRWEPLGSGLNPLTVRVGALLLLFHVVAVWALVRGHSRALRHLTIGALAGLLLAPCASRAALTIANGAGDVDISTHERVLDHKRKVESDDSTSYYFYFPAVPGMAEDSLKLSVSSRQFNAASQGDAFQLTIGSGKLGTPWLLDLERLSSGR